MAGKTIKLAQVTASLVGRKTFIEKEVGHLRQVLQKREKFDGFVRAYLPDKADDVDRYPEERKLVEQKAAEVLQQAVQRWVQLFDDVLVQDDGNQLAKADLVLDDGTVLAKDVPITYLLFLDKQLDDFETLVEDLPTPHPSEEWTPDPALGMLRSKPKQQVRTRKEPELLKKIESTADGGKSSSIEYQAIYVDKRVGVYETVAYSGAISADVKHKILENARSLQLAVRRAKEMANQIPVVRRDLGSRIFDYLLKGS